MLRLVLTLAVLLYASLLDWRHREIDDRSWMALLALGFLFFLADFYRFQSGVILKYFVLSVFFSFFLASVLFYTGLMGGGDGKILIGIGAMYPFYPTQILSVFPLFVMSVFTNAILLAALVPFGLFVLNVKRLRDVKSARDFLVLFLGYQKRANEVSEFEAVIGQRGKYSLFIDTRTVELGKKRDSDEPVWVSPAIPFLIFITLAFILAYKGVDIFTQITFHLPWNSVLLR
jgi:preflagellin peptidase FlaK